IAASCVGAQDAFDGTTSSFVLPFLLPASQSFADGVVRRRADLEECSRRHRDAVERIEVRVCQHYAFGQQEQIEIAAHAGDQDRLAVPSLEALSDEMARALVPWAVGVAFGRFDVRLATGSRPLPDAVDPFATVSPIAPGALPAGAPPDGYPIQVDKDGILVD